MKSSDNKILQLNKFTAINILSSQDMGSDCKYSKKLIEKLILINESMLDKVDILEIKKAIYYAKKYHGEQKRESGEPYYSHPLEVAYMLADYCFNEKSEYVRTDVLVSSILHDTLEDTDLTYDMIEEVFGKTVASQVESLTRIKVKGKITSEELVISLLLEDTKDVLMIKMFDRLHNIQTIKHKSPEKIKRIVDETIKVFLLLGVYLEMMYVTKILIKFCYDHLHVKQGIYSLTDISSVFAIDNFQLPSLNSRNELVQSNTQ